MKSTTFAFALVGSAAAAIPAYNNATSAAAAPYASASAASYGSCEDQYDSCRSVTDPNNPPNFSACAAAYSACLGYNPFASSGSNTVTAASGPTPYVTQIVTSLETYCPSATTLTYNSKTYTVTEPTTLTITDCPCQHTVPAYQVPQAQTITAVVPSFTTVCPTPTIITTKSKTYTVTSATTLTITHCPGGCTVTTAASYVCPTTTATLAPPTYKPSGSKPPVTVTKMVSSYTTYCPYPTTLTVQSATYVVSSASTVTVKCPGGCPIQTVVPAPSSYAPVSSPKGSMVPVPSSYAPAPSSSVVVSPVPSAPAPAPSASVAGGQPVTQISDGQIQAPATSAGAQSGSPSASAPAQYTGAAEKVLAGGSVFAAGLAAALML